MHTAAKKLKSQRGASIIFALLVFMLCAFGGVAALVSAAANAGRYARLEDDQQQYLSASSAAGLLRDELSGKTVSVKLTMRHVHTWWYANTAAVGSPPVYARYDCDQYAFLDAADPTASIYDPADEKACVVQEVSPVPGGTDMIQALMPFLKPYFINSLLQNAAPSYFFDQKDSYRVDGGTPQPLTAGTGTGPRPAADTSQQRRLVITGSEDGGTAQEAAWHDKLGIVRALMSGIGDYGLRAEVSWLPDDDAGDDEALYTTVFELPAQVKREITSQVTRQDKVQGIPAIDGLPAGSLAGVTSYGQETVDNVVTVTVEWTGAVPVVTRIY